MSPAEGTGAPLRSAVEERKELLRAVQRFQVARMRATHAVLFRTPGYGPLCEFFVRDLYGPHDFGARTATFHSITHLLRPVLGRRIFEGAVGLVELQMLSERLDGEVAAALSARGASLGFSEAEFEAAYLACDDYRQRVWQIELSARSIAFVHELSGHRTAGRLLALARGFKSLHSVEPTLAMLERGYHAFRGAGDIGPFIAAMRSGETAYLQRIYARRDS